MDPCLYRAAREGDFTLLMQNNHRLEEQVTGTNNTVLHVATLFGQLNTVTEILRVSPSLLCRKNLKGETSLHIAAREGHSGIINALIECAKTLHVGLESGAEAASWLLRMTNEDGDTALHEAARSQDTEAVRLLVEEDPDFSYPANNAEETPLYLVAEEGNAGLLSVILENCASPDYNGPGGKSALHGAVTSNSQACTVKILERKPTLAKKADKFGWTPLHCAVYCGNPLLVKQLLDLDKSTAYVADNEEKCTALHIAARQDRLDLMKELIAQCPDCWEMVNGKGRNILHIAVHNGYEGMINFILRDDTFKSLINQKDFDGNTPLHLLAAFEHYVPELIKHPTTRKNVFNKKNFTPLEFINAASWGTTKRDLIKGGATLGRRNIGQKKIVKNVPKDLRKMDEARLIVATLIATVTFAAGFTVPGGYDSNPGPTQGMPILRRGLLFQAFMVTDSIALVCSTFAICLYFKPTNLNICLQVKQFGVPCIIVAMVAMMLAFFTGLSAALRWNFFDLLTVLVSINVLLFGDILWSEHRRKKSVISVVREFFHTFTFFTSRV